MAKPSGEVCRESSVIAAQVGGPAVPTSTVKAGHQGVSYCVSGYAPSRSVVVRNERTGASATIHANNHGAGCGRVPGFACGQGDGDRVIALGTGADGNPATSSATITAADAPGCVTSAQAAPSSSASSTGNLLSGADLVLLGVAGAVLLALAAVAVVAVRRRRAGAGA
ncbi:MAG: hypothetical protein ACTHK4_11180 [Mycobacteriales bacterium]